MSGFKLNFLVTTEKIAENSKAVMIAVLSFTRSKRESKNTVEVVSLLGKIQT